jgi:hypothetical protein
MSSNNAPGHLALYPSPIKGQEEQMTQNIAMLNLETSSPNKMVSRESI